MIYDCFTFFSELDLLEIRLHTLAPVVDRFVLVEATRTYGGNEKPLFLKENWKRFEAFSNKITTVTVYDRTIATETPEMRHSPGVAVGFGYWDIPTGTDPASHWQREYHQRNAILKGLGAAQPDDVILISDVDEIPRPEKVRGKLPPGLILLYDQAFYYYNFNSHVRQAWFGTRAMRYDTLMAMPVLDTTPMGHMGDWGGPVQTARYAGKFWQHSPMATIYGGGWHFSHFGGPEIIRTKLLNGAHQEVNRPEWTDVEGIARRIREGRDLFDRPDMPIEPIPDNQDLPAPVLANPARYAAHFAEGVVA